MPYCPSCSKFCGEQHDLNQHLASMHPFRCTLCQIDLRNSKAFDKHAKYSPNHIRSAKVISASRVSTTSQPQSVKSKASVPHQPPDRGQAKTTESSPSVPQATNHGGTSASQPTESQWSVIPASQLLLELQELWKQCHTQEDLIKNGYLLRPYTADDLEGLRECKRCKMSRKKAVNGNKSECRFHPGDGGIIKRKAPPKPFSCCGATSTRGCTSLPSHDYATLDARLATKYQSYAATPPHSQANPKFRAVTLDCEMAGVMGGDNAVILICAADYFTGAILVNKFVIPEEKVIGWRTEIHGINKSTVLSASSRGQALAGWKGAREELWKCIDDETILVGHALQHDLHVLRMIHSRVVDSAILTRNAVGIGHRQWGLQTLCEELVQIGIRNNSKEIHDCMEDVLATREVVLWCTRNQQQLNHWAAIKRQEEERKEQEKRLRQQERDAAARAEMQEAKNLSFESSNALFGCETEEDEMLQLLNIA